LCVAEFISGGGRGGYDNQRSDSRGGGGGRGGYNSNFNSGSNYSGESGNLNSRSDLKLKLPDRLKCY